MLALCCGALWAGLVAYLLSRVIRQFRAHRSTALVVSGEQAMLPAVSIIIPVRNEIDNVIECLAGVEAQLYLGPRSEIIVVDDGSEDGTAEAVQPLVAAGEAIKLAAAGPLPPGWVGKPHACWRGASLAEGDWLCFIDADVRTGPELVITAVSAAEAQSIDMLSLHPFQQLGSFWERLVLPAGLLMIACAKDIRTTQDPASWADIVNGQFLLIRRHVYFDVGGHAAVAAEICEDKALAIKVKQAGYRLRVLTAEHLASTRMYRDFGSLWGGLSKNATEMIGSLSLTIAAGIAGFVVGWTALFLPIVLGAIFLSKFSMVSGVGCGLALLASAVVIGIQIGTARHFRIPAAFGLIYALGYTVAACLACRSALAHLNGRVTWKGRTYQLKA
jgi:chlorobactene glucosyltransferase